MSIHFFVFLEIFFCAVAQLFYLFMFYFNCIFIFWELFFRAVAQFFIYLGFISIAYLFFVVFLEDFFQTVARIFFVFYLI